MNRRTFLASLFVAVPAPAIVRASSLMHISPVPTTLAELGWTPAHHYATYIVNFIDKSDQPTRLMGTVESYPDVTTEASIRDLLAPWERIKEITNLEIVAA